MAQTTRLALFGPVIVATILHHHTAALLHCLCNPSSSSPSLSLHSLVTQLLSSFVVTRCCLVVVQVGYSWLRWVVSHCDTMK